MPRSKKLNPSELERLKAVYDREITDGMAELLWKVAYKDWREEATFCENCDAQIWEDEHGNWVDATDSEACEATDGDHEPADDGGNDDDIPETPMAASKAADDLAKLIVAENGMSLADLYEWAMTVHAGEYEFKFADVDGRGPAKDDPETFGTMLAFEALGHGISWADDHKTKRSNASFDPTIPTFECHYDGDELHWSGRARGGGEITHGHGGYMPPSDLMPTGDGDLFVVFRDQHGSTYAERYEYPDDPVEAVTEAAERYAVAEDGDRFQWTIVRSTDAGRARLQPHDGWRGEFTYHDDGEED